MTAAAREVDRRPVNWEMYGPMIAAGWFIVAVQFVVGILVNHTLGFHFSGPTVDTATVGDLVTFLRVLFLCAGGAVVIGGCLLARFDRGSPKGRAVTVRPVAGSQPLVVPQSPPQPSALLCLPDENGLRTAQQVLDYLAARGIRQEILAQLREGDDQ